MNIMSLNILSFKSFNGIYRTTEETHCIGGTLSSLWSSSVHFRLSENHTISVAWVWVIISLCIKQVANKDTLVKFMAWDFWALPYVQPENITYILSIKTIITNMKGGPSMQVARNTCKRSLPDQTSATDKQSTCQVLDRNERVKISFHCQSP